MLAEVVVLSIAKGAMVYDGQYYKDGDEIHDLGSFVATSVDGKIRSYQGLSKDIDKLPKYDDLGTGSSALCVDTGQFYKYEKTTKQWYEL